MFFNQIQSNNPPHRKPNHAWKQALLLTLLLALLAYLTPAFASGGAESLPLSAEALLNDPLSITEVKLTASDMNSGDQFGHSVSLSGDLALVGAPYNYEQGERAGAAYLLRWNGSQWVQEAKLVANDGTADDYFGYAVSLSGEVALVGAYGDHDDGSYFGSAYIFRKDGNDWVQEAKLTANDGAASLLFGYSVSLAGDVALIGAHQDDGAGTTSGSAYIFRLHGSQWVQEAKLMANDGTVDDHFAHSVSVAGDVALVGAYQDDEHGSYSGSAYIFRKDGNDWVQEAKLIANDGATYDYFGYSVSLVGDMALVGAYGSSSGAAYVFGWTGSEWLQEAKLTPNDDISSGSFGKSVSLSGDVALVGAYGDNIHGSFSGSAYLFRLDGSQWVQESKLMPNDGAMYDYFGRSVSVAGNLALVGASGDDEDIEGEDVGAAYLYNLSAGSVPDISLNETSILGLAVPNSTDTIDFSIKNGGTEPLSWSLSSGNADWLNVSPTSGTVASAGTLSVTVQFNAAELTLGTYSDTLTITSNDPDEASLVIPLLLRVIPPPNAKLTVNDGAVRGRFGRSVSVAGDVALVGADGDDEHGYHTGAVYIFRWNGSQWIQEAKLTANDGAQGDYFGQSVSLAGDVALVGASGDDEHGSRTGAAYIFRKNGNQWVQEAKLTANDGAADHYFGQSVSLAGNVALVGAHQDNEHGSDSGAAYIFRLHGSQWVQETKLTANDGAADDSFGYSVSLAGDVALIGAALDDEHGSRSGSAYIFAWNGSQWVQEAKFSPNDGTTYDFFGFSVSLAGSVALVGAAFDNEDGRSSGSAYIFRKNGNDWVQEAKLTPNDGGANDFFGYSVSLAGDVALIGVHRDDDHGSASGSAYIFAWDGSQWMQKSKITANDGATDDFFGGSVSLAGDVIFAGAPFDDDNGPYSGSAYVYELSAIIGAPALEVSPASFSVALPQGQRTSETLTISNTGALRLTWEMRENAGWLNTMPLSGSVVPSDSVTVSLGFDARGLSVGSYTETLRINSNDPDQPTIELPVTLSVTPAPPPDILAIHALGFDSDPTSDVNLSPLFHQTIGELVEVTAENRDRMAVVLADLDGAADTRIFVVRDGYVTSIVGLPDAAGLLSQGLSEYDMTDGETLGGFLKWALETYAAAETKTSFSYVSHGTFLMPAVELSTLFTDTMALRTPSSGEGSIFPLPADVYAKSSFSDQHPQQAMITPHALQVALDIASNGGNAPLDVLDIVHCFSGSIEEFYELSNAGGLPYATTLVGSANYSYFAPQMLARALATFEAQDDAATMASKIVETYDLVLQEVDQLDDQPTSRHPRTMVAMQSSQIPMIKDKIDEMAWYLMQEFETDPIATKDKLAAAYGATGGYYDTTYCSPQDWELASPDALVDIEAFMTEVRQQFGTLSGVGIRAQQVASAVTSAVITHRAQSGTPWFATPLTPTWNLESEALSGLALYADLEGQALEESRLLSWHTRFYTDSTSIAAPNDNPYPYLFVQGGYNGQTWADVFYRFWQVKSQAEGLTLEAAICLSDLPPALRSSEVSLEHIIFPNQGAVYLDSPTTLAVALHAEQIAPNPLVAFKVLDANSTLVFSETVAAGYLLTGTHQVEATTLWTPTLEGSFTLEVMVDADNRLIEQDESNNVAIMSDQVFIGNPFELNTTTLNKRQWFDTRTIEVEVQSDVSLDYLVVQVYEYVPGTSPNMQVPVMSHEMVLDSPTLPVVSLELPPEVEAGAITLHLWGVTGGELSQHADVVHLSYHPNNRQIGYNSDYYRFEAQTGERVELSLDVTAGEASLYVWDNPWTARQIDVTSGQNGRIVIDPAPAGKLIIKVKGLTDDAQYTINAQHNQQLNRHLLPQAQLVQEARPTFIEPIPQLPQPAPPSAVILDAFVTLQGRPTPPHERLSVPLSVSLTVPGEDAPSYEFEVMTDQNGHFSLMGIDAGTYEMRVKKSSTLQTLLTVDIEAGSNSFDVGILREGDANNDNVVNILDFSILASTFGKCEADDGYDERTDFNGDGCVTILDFSLLASNFGQAGDMAPLAAPSHLRQLATEASLVVAPDTREVAVGENFTMRVLVQAAQPIDGAQACLNFDPSLLQVRQISRGSALPLELAKQFDNETGMITLAAGALSDFPNDTFKLAELEFEALAQTDGTEVAFQFDSPCQSDVTFGGASVLSSHTNGTIIVKQAPTAVTVGRLSARSGLPLAGGLLLALIPVVSACYWLYGRKRA